MRAQGNVMRVKRFTDVKVEDGGCIMVTVERKRGGRGRMTVVADYDPDEVSEIRVRVIEQGVDGRSQDLA